MVKFGWVDVLIVILFLLSVYLILTRIFGRSATDLAIGVSLFTFLGILIYQNNINTTNHIIKLNREFGEFKIKTINSFDKLKEDLGEIKDKIGRLK